MRCSAALSGEQILRAGSALLALALAGVCGWGLAASMQATDDPIPSFWTVVDAAQAKVSQCDTATTQRMLAAMGSALFLRPIGSLLAVTPSHVKACIVEATLAAPAQVDTATATLRALSGQMGQLSDALAVLSAQAPRECAGGSAALPLCCAPGCRYAALRVALRVALRAALRTAHMSAWQD